MIWLHPILPASQNRQTYPILHREKKDLEREKEWGKPWSLCQMFGGKRHGAKSDDS